MYAYKKILYAGGTISLRENHTEVTLYIYIYIYILECK